MPAQNFGPGAPTENGLMGKRWCIYLAALAISIGLYVTVPGWIAWTVLLTVAGTPLFSVVVRVAVILYRGVSTESGWTYDCLGLFRLPVARAQGTREYAQALRAYRPGDSLSRVHWKLMAKTGTLIVRQERESVRFVPPLRQRRIWAIVPTGLCLAILVCAFPPGRYEQQMRALQALFVRRQEVRFDLTAGPRMSSQQPVMDVVASESQMLYLRGQAYDIYDGRSWRVLNRKDDCWPEQDASGAGTVTIATRTVQGHRYFPYYVAGENLKFDRGALGNPDRQQEYTYRQQRTVVGRAQNEALPPEYLTLPEETRAWAEDVLAGLLGQKQMSDGEKLEKIQNFVRSCAKYEPNTAATPEETEFVRWFVEESGKGYCVHFATAAAVLLRCAQIPARFVTGYAVQVQGGLRKTVVSDDAHAWVEYWDGGVWRILEATPTVEAAPPGERPAETEIVEERASKFGAFWFMVAVIIVQMWVCLRQRNRWDYVRLMGRLLREDVSHLENLVQKAAFSRYGLTPVEKKIYENWRKRIIFFPLRETRRERKCSAVKQEEKKPITWEVADPKPPIIQSGKMENRKQN